MPVAASIVLGYAGVGEASIELILKTVEEILIAVDTHKHVGCPVPFDDDGRGRIFAGHHTPRYSPKPKCNRSG